MRGEEGGRTPLATQTRVRVEVAKFKMVLTYLPAMGEIRRG